MSITTYTRRRAAGLCGCGAPLEGDHGQCDVCREHTAAGARRRRQARREAGCCIDCGQVRRGRWACWPCWWARRARARLTEVEPVTGTARRVGGVERRTVVRCGECSAVYFKDEAHRCGLVREVDEARREARRVA